MDEMQILVPVAVKSKLTEALKTTLLNEINTNLSRVEHDMAQLEFQANGRIAEQAKVNIQAASQLRASFEAQKAQMQQVKEKLTHDKEHLEKLAIGAELNRAPINRLVTIHVGVQKALRLFAEKSFGVIFHVKRLSVPWDLYKNSS